MEKPIELFQATSRMVPVEKIKPAKYNPRELLKPGDEEYTSLKASLDEFGLSDPLVWNESTGNLVGGHQRFTILTEEYHAKEISCAIVKITDLKREMALNLALNRIRGRPDAAKLKAVFVELKGEGLLLNATGYQPLEVHQALLYVPETEKIGLTDDDAVPEAPKVAKTKHGDLYVLGGHRLLCGDSTKRRDVERLMDGRLAVLMNTDPPYGIAYVANAQSKNQSESHDDIENDDLDGEKLQEFLETTIRSAVPNLTENAAFYLWHPMLTQGTFFAAAAAAADILIHRQIIWVKPSLVFGRGDYHWQHELCFYGWRRGHRPEFYGERNQTTIWAVGRENDGIHPTQKPVELFLRPISNHTKPDEIIYEPFGGSGSQFIAAEKTARRCFGMEISEVYCDVIVSRWENFSGQTAQRIPSKTANVA